MVNTRCYWAWSVGVVGVVEYWVGVVIGHDQWAWFSRGTIEKAWPLTCFAFPLFSFPFFSLL